jgi:acyl carrier protein
MEKQVIIEKINKFLIEEIEIEESDISPEASLSKDLGIDSLDFIDIVVIVEKTFGFKIKGEDMKDIKTLEMFYDYVEQKVNQN